MSSSEDSHMCQTSTSIPNRDSSTSTTEALGTKRKPEVVDWIPNVQSQVKAACVDVDNNGPGPQWMGQSVTDPKAAAWHEYNTTLQRDNQCREEEAVELLSQPKRMRQLPEPSSAAGHRVGVDPHTAELSQKPLSHFCTSQNIQKQINRTENKIQDFQSDFAMSHQEQPIAGRCRDTGTDSQSDVGHQEPPTPGRCRDTGSDPLESLIPSESGFWDVLGSVGRTSTQKPSVHTYKPQIDEENDHYHLKCSEPQYEHLDKWTEPKLKISKHSESDQVRAKAEEHGIFSKQAAMKPKDSLSNNRRVKDPLTQNLHENTIDLLFTQDSEGLRVIAHRGPWASRNPLKDHTNLGLVRDHGTGAQKYVVYEEEEEMLFTQDSQGNMVIKH